ncbi:MAG: hypothetical protein Q4B77_07715 [Coriobacteriaceae bacterium]|nr:hypothetical protein [Coriobacteriaceae bacterium]
MFESVFYTVAPMLVVAAVALPVGLVLSVCAGVHKYAEWREFKAAQLDESAQGDAAEASER